MIQKQLLAVAISLAGAVSLLAQAPMRAVTLGDPVVHRPLLQSPLGQVVIYAGPGFIGPGMVTSWSFFDSAIHTNSTHISPLLFERTNQTDFILRGTGSFRQTFGGGIVQFAFDPEAGDQFIHPGYTFGFVNRAVGEIERFNTNWLGSGSPNNGVVEYGYVTNSTDATPTTASKWYFTSDEDFGMHIGQVYRLNGISDGDTIALHEDLLGRRAYSMQMTAQIVIPDILSIRFVPSNENPLVLCWATTPDKQYQVEWAQQLGGHWQELGTTIPGDGQTTCVRDAPGEGTSRFYRLRISPK